MKLKTIMEITQKAVDRSFFHKDTENVGVIFDAVFHNELELKDIEYKYSREGNKIYINVKSKKFLKFLIIITKPCYVYIYLKNKWILTDIVVAIPSKYFWNGILELCEFSFGV